MVIIDEYLDHRVSKRAAGVSQSVMFSAARNYLLALSMLVMAVVASQPVYAQQQFDQQEVSISQAEIDQILAPIALYPDSLLTHILIASTYPLEVVQANRWVQANSRLSSEQILKLAEQQNWDPSIQALTAFPDVLQRMSDNLDWTQTLGDTFLYDEEFVLASIQNLRQKAHANGSLDNLDRISVVVDGDYIVLEPYQRDVVYVPYYDVKAVYGPWWWNHYPPVSFGFGYHYSGFRFIWGPSVYVGSRIAFAAFSWHKRYVVRANRSAFYRKSNVIRNQILRHRTAKRWVHSPLHRRNIGYSHARINKRYTPHRAYRPSSRFSYGNRSTSLKKKNLVKLKRVEKQRRVSTLNQRLKNQRSTSQRGLSQNRQVTNRTVQNRQNVTRNSQPRNNRIAVNSNAERSNRVGNTDRNTRVNDQRQRNNSQRIVRNNNQNSRVINQRNSSGSNSVNKTRTVKVSKNNLKTKSTGSKPKISSKTKTSSKEYSNNSSNKKYKQSSSSKYKYSANKNKNPKNRQVFRR